MSSLIANIPLLQRKQEECSVVLAIQHNPIWQKAQVVALYRAKMPEFSVDILIQDAWNSKKRTAFPVILPNDGLAFRIASSWNDFIPATFGLLEPKCNCPIISAENIDIYIVPGLAFDLHGNRLGRGKGYYDRFFAGVSLGVSPPIPTLSTKVSTPAIWGIAFCCQVMEHVPHDYHDHKMDVVWYLRKE